MKKFTLALYTDIFAKADEAQDTTALLEVLEEIESITRGIDYSSYEAAKDGEIKARNIKAREIEEKFVRLLVYGMTKLARKFTYRNCQYL
ncbi:MAG: hypothetical protein FWE33_04670 [Defluviitaleaceae bacterium]|nr:hypothetical protein [Defluviitaleaceae bacterium]